MFRHFSLLSLSLFCAISCNANSIEDLLCAIRLGNSTEIAYIIEQNPSILEERDASGNTLLHYAVYSQEIYHLLKFYDLDDSIKNQNGDTPKMLFDAQQQKDCPRYR